MVHFYKIYQYICFYSFQTPDGTELSNICASTINLLSSTVDNLRPCLWNTLLTLLSNPAFDSAVPIVAKALAQIAPKTSPEEGEYCMCYFNNKSHFCGEFIYSYSILLFKKTIKAKYLLFPMLF